MTQYNERVLRSYADGLYVTAAMVIAGWVLLGVIATGFAVSFIEKRLNGEDVRALEAARKSAVEQAAREHDIKAAQCKTFIGAPEALARTEECIEAAKTRIEYRISDYQRQSRLMEWLSGAILLTVSLLIGIARTFKYKLEAQKILCQVEIEQHLRCLTRSKASSIG